LVEAVENKSSKKSIQLDSFAEVCDRVGVSDRNAALLSSSLLEDVDLVSEENKEGTIDRNKIRRKGKKARSELEARVDKTI